jgi:hypothetical protein
MTVLYAYISIAVWLLIAVILVVGTAIEIVRWWKKRH